MKPETKLSKYRFQSLVRSFAIILTVLVSASLAATTGQAVDVFSVDALFRLNANDGDQASVARYYASIAGGGQRVIYDANSTATIDGGFVFPGLSGALVFDDKGNIVAGNEGVGRWHAVEQVYADIRRFGAKGEANTDDTRAIQSAINASLSIRIPTGRFRHKGLVVDTPNTKIVGQGRGSMLVLVEPNVANLDAKSSFLIFRDFTLLTESGASNNIGLLISNCSRSTFDSLQIGLEHEGHTVGIKMFGATRNWLNNFVNCQINYNTIGIHGIGHGSRVSGGEIQGGHHGIVQSKLDANGDPNTIPGSVGNLGSGITIADLAIEGQSHRASIAYGIFWTHSQNFPSVRRVYFEKIGRLKEPGNPQSQRIAGTGVAIQVGLNTGPSGMMVFAGSIRDCFFADIPIGVSICRADGLSISNNYAPPSTQRKGYYLIDASGASLDSYVSIHDNYCDNSHYIHDPGSHLENSYVSGSNIGVRGGGDVVNRSWTFNAKPKIDFADIALQGFDSQNRPSVIHVAQQYPKNKTGRHFYLRMTGAGVLSGSLHFNAYGFDSPHVGTAAAISISAIKESGNREGDESRNGDFSMDLDVAQPPATPGAVGLPAGIVSVQSSNATDHSYTDIEVLLSSAASGVPTVSSMTGVLTFSGSGTCVIFDDDDKLLKTIR